MEECLLDMKKILDDNNQHFFLTCGTLLGQHRQNNFISYDYDIDIGIIYNKYNDNIKNHILNSSKFKLFHVLGKKENSLEFQFKHINGIRIDIMLFYPVNETEDDYFYYASFWYCCSNKPGGFCKWGRHIRGFKEVDFINKKFNVPMNTDEYLTECYGEDWRIPKTMTYQEGLQGGYKNLLN
jgi:phosphorylcholine metabolism protein LicD